VIHYSYYADVPADAVRALVAAARLCRLVTVGAAQFPQLGLYPFTQDETGFALHLHRADEQLADLRERPACVLEVDEVLSDIPSHWIDPHDASFASAFHRTVAFECTATLSNDPAALARQQNLLLARYQPEGGFRPVAADDPDYTPMLRLLVGVRLEVRATKVKFKLAQNRDLATRAKIVERLRERGSALDARTAEALQWTIDLEWTTQGRRR
jgi:predicted FMN-binding regulatory protein PaiB